MIQRLRPHLRPASSQPETVRIDEVVKKHAGGTQSVASVAVIDGETKFLKSSRPSMYGRYANFEADILAHDLFEAVEIEAPDAEIVRLPASELRDYLGEEVLAIDFVDQKFVDGDRVGVGGWNAPKNADLDSYMKMVLLDFIMGNADRRGANYFNRYCADGKARPVPIDNDSALGNLFTQKLPTNHMNFVQSYEVVGESRGARQNGTIANMLLDTMLHYELLDEAHEQKRCLELAQEMIKTLSDSRIDSLVERLPASVMPSDLDVSLKELKPHIDPATFEVVRNHTPDEISGEQAFAFRKSQLKQTLAWRRDNLIPALEKYFAQLNDPNVDPIDDCSKDWNMV